MGLRTVATSVTGLPATIHAAGIGEGLKAASPAGSRSRRPGAPLVQPDLRIDTRAGQDEDRGDEELLHGQLRSAVHGGQSNGSDIIRASSFNTRQPQPSDFSISPRSLVYLR